MGILLSQIEDDLKKCFDARGQHARSPSPRALYERLFYGTRALLIVKGLEASSEAEVFELFQDNFITPGLVPSKYQKLMASGRAAAEERAIGENAESEIDGFCSHVFDLYENMDESLHFPGEPAYVGYENGETTSGGELANEDEVSLSVDYRGIPCPMNYVKAKLVLETMSNGQRLEIFLDDGEPIENVPRSLADDGQSVETPVQIAGYWRVVVTKTN